MKTNVYIDGFNFYYGAVRSTTLKWLDFSELCQRLLPTHTVNRIRYFTANALPLPNDPYVNIRQQVYLRALKTIPNLEVCLGHFERREKVLPLAVPIPGCPPFVRVATFEEKGSDVNLASYLLLDGYAGDYEQALVISNDSDLALPIELVKTRLGLPVGVANPDRRPEVNVPFQLRSAATFNFRIKNEMLGQCQFPTKLTDANGTFHKPPSW